MPQEVKNNGQRKRVGILTFHFVENQGAVLQTFALQSIIEELGYDVQIINYMPQYHVADYKVFISPLYIYSKNRRRGRSKINSFLRAIYSQRRNFFWRQRKAAIKSFERFRSEYLNRTEKMAAIEQLNEIVKLFDAIVVGSDQIWNVDMTNQKFDEVYFGELGCPNLKKIAYAASAKGLIAETHRTDFVNLIEGMAAISTRESDLAKQITDWTGRECETVLDPTLLMSKDQWNLMIKKPSRELPKGKYLLTYMPRGGRFDELSQEIARQKGLVIVQVNLKQTTSGGQLWADVAPDEFVYLLKNAECVLVSSFHGTALSIIFEKDFYTFIPESLLQSNDSRMTNILAAVGLEDRIVSGQFQSKSPIEYEAVKREIERLRKGSLQYLKNALRG